MYNERKFYFLTWVTHNSRISERMISFGIKAGDPVLLDPESEATLGKILVNIILEQEFECNAIMVCCDHVHAIIRMEDEEIPKTMQILKGKSTTLMKRHLGIAKEERLQLWAQKYHVKVIPNEEILKKARNYILTNREKHKLPLNPELLEILSAINENNQSYFFK